MADLISRAAAIEHMKSMAGCATCNNYNEVRCRACSWDDAMNIVDELPAVDAAPIIRCVNCKWWNGSTLGAAHRCAALHIATTGEFYCAVAERKSNCYGVAEIWTEKPKEE